MALTGGAAYALSQQYVNETLIGGGALKGKNCTIDNIEDITGGHQITFKWTLDDNSVRTRIMKVMDGITPLVFLKNPEVSSIYLATGDSFLAPETDFNRTPEDNDQFVCYITTKDSEKDYLYITVCEWHDNDSRAYVVDFERITTTGLKALFLNEPVEHNLSDGGNFEIPKINFSRDINGTYEDCLVFDKNGHYQSVRLTVKNSTTLNATPIGDLVNLNVGSVKYTHEQATASDEWRIQHNLNFKYPAVALYDTDGNDIVGDIEYFSDNLLIVTFSEAVSGKGIISK